MNDTIETICAILFFAFVWIVLVYAVISTYESVTAMKQGYCQYSSEGKLVWLKCRVEL